MQIDKIIDTGVKLDDAISFIREKAVLNDSLKKDELVSKLKPEFYSKISKILKNTPVYNPQNKEWPNSLAPPSLDPNETILARLASGASVKEIDIDADTGKLTIIGDANGLFYPLGDDGSKRSNGPNAVYIPGRGKRINLFSSKNLKVSPSKLLARYITFRDQNIGGIIDLAIGMIDNPGGRGKLADYGDKADDMKLIASLLRKLKQQGIKTKAELNDAGMDIVSFCQTWDPVTDEANFSVMSPHFQNRLYITNPDLLKGKEVSDDEIQAYNDAVASMTTDKAFLEAYARPPRFINLDKLNETGRLSVAIGGKKRRTRKNKKSKKGKKTRKLNKKGRKTRKLRKRGKKGKRTTRRY